MTDLPDPFDRLRAATRARVALGRAGDALPTARLLELRGAHAAARDAVHSPLDAEALAAEIRGLAGGGADGVGGRRGLAGGGADGVGGRRGLAGGGADGVGGRIDPEVLVVRSAAADRAEYLQRPDLGRRLGAGELPAGEYDVAFVVADGLSPLAVHTHAVPMLREILDRLDGWRVAPIVVATQARVALGDAVGAALGAKTVVVLVGERPGMSSTDSLGLYLTYDPKPGRRDSERNCLSNVRPPHGTGYPEAATVLAMLLEESRRLRLSGVKLKADPALEA